MKRKITFIALLLCLLMIGGCGKAITATDTAVPQNEATMVQDEAGTETQTDTKEDESIKEALPSDDQVAEEKAETASGSTDVLVVFFSRTGEQYGVGVIDKGNTAIVAEMIAEKTGADTFEILPQEDYYPYTYDELTDIAKKELNDNARPAYAGEVPDLSQYSTIFIGAPVWWGDWPMICYTFFEKNADGLAGKTLIPFSTHAGSGLSGFDSKLSGACPNSTVGTGLAIRGADAQNDQDSVRKSVNDWLAGLGY